MMRHISVIGAGVGGLATAARLAQRGYKVDVYEKLPRCGGRAHIIEDRGFKFDTGPSFVLMPDFFEELFGYCKKDINDYLTLLPLDIHYKIFYPHGQTLTVFRDPHKTKQELERIEEGSARRYDSFIEEVARMYALTRPLLYKCFTPDKLLNPLYWGLLGKLKTYKTYWQIARQFFKTKELAYAFTFEAMFIGVSPFHAPAFYSIITYVDHVQKIYHPQGGMYQIPQALEKLAVELGASFHYQEEVRSLKSTKSSVTIETERDRYSQEAAVVNADYAYARRELLGENLPRYKYSCSTYLLYLGLKKKVKNLEHHNLFFSYDLDKNLKEIFEDYILPQDPSFYVHVPTITDPSLAPEGKDIVYILVPVPNLAHHPARHSDYEQKLRQIIFDKINLVIGERIENLIEVQHSFYPQDFIRRYNIYNAATFGLAHTLMQSAFFRPPNLDRRFKNIYFVGCSTQPGGGLPPVIASSRVVADLIAKTDTM